jgi:Asp-tRNA(Asn)/Glu-tRNA(Gln) amidotransferase A subunit family amidase
MPSGRAPLDSIGRQVSHVRSKTVDDLNKAIQTGLVTIEQLTDMYLARVAAYDDAGPLMNAFLHVNARAALEANQLESAPAGLEPATLGLEGRP